LLRKEIDLVTVHGRPYRRSDLPESEREDDE
jgi:hypothetical protein